MKWKVILVTYAAISILGLLFLLARENTYIAIAIISCFLLLGHREIWSLLRYRKFPVIDERIWKNLTSAMRFTGVFFFIACIVLILLLRFNVFQNTPTAIVISSQLIIIGFVYLLTYYYYDRVSPNLGQRALQWVKYLLVIAGLAISTIAFSIVMHNLVSSWIGYEEGFFFILGLFVSPGILALAFLSLLVVYIKGLIASFTGSERA